MTYRTQSCKQSKTSVPANGSHEKFTSYNRNHLLTTVGLLEWLWKLHPLVFFFKGFVAAQRVAIRKRPQLHLSLDVKMDKLSLLTCSMIAHQFKCTCGVNYEGKRQETYIMHQMPWGALLHQGEKGSLSICIATSLLEPGHMVERDNACHAMCKILHHKWKSTLFRVLETTETITNVSSMQSSSKKRSCTTFLVILELRWYYSNSCQRYSQDSLRVNLALDCKAMHR